MNKTLALCSTLLILSTVTLSACNQANKPAQTGFVYVMTNAPSGNSVLIFEQGENGTLSSVGSVETQGKGTGSSLNPLGSQGALALSEDGKWLLAVNAGSNEISVLKVTPDGLEFAGKTSSLGQFPVSLTVSGGRVFVLNQKSMPPAVNQFSMDKNGVMTANPGATRLLPPGTYTQVALSPNGKWLAIAGESNGLLLMYAINGTTISSDPITVESSGRGPAGLAFDKDGNLLVTEAASNSISSYSVSSDGLKPITASLPGGQKFPRWIAVAGSFAYVANSGSNNISVFALSATSRGQLTAAGTVSGAGSGLTELAVSSDGKYLYAIDPPSRSIEIFKIQADGSLVTAGSLGALFGVSVQGIAAG